MTLQSCKLDPKSLFSAHFMYIQLILLHHTCEVISISITSFPFAILPSCSASSSSLKIEMKINCTWRPCLAGFHPSLLEHMVKILF